MSMPPAPGFTRQPPLTVHPHEVGVQDFDSYALIVDARSASRFAEDHIPGAVSAPLAARAAGAGRQAVPDRWRELVAALDPGSAVLLYAHSGERLLDAPAACLRELGLVVEVLDGGWQAYRRWVLASLEMLPRMFEFRVLSSSSADLASAVLDALDDLGEQVIHLAAAPSEAAFETALLDILRHRETDRRLWIVDPAMQPKVKLPPAVDVALRAAPRTLVSLQRAEPGRQTADGETLVVESIDATALRAAVERFVLALGDQSKP
jgi:tRNA 2-selenouridine synthase